ncbi:hypothetical protein [Burkholderia sp. Bp9143]|uniref:hypothetical protein n=1 Tax=Burkholderia sp. Bp9143 TaxID=2184574 RepID=UPI000F5A63BB|nr:hypothetical protein [Burkholderia sp. Bp9143]
MSGRTPQQILSSDVGVTRKWVICRQSQHEATVRLAGGEPVGLAELAQAFGNFDRVHFTCDFRKLVGSGTAEHDWRGPIHLCNEISEMQAYAFLDIAWLPTLASIPAA